ncbi:MAG: serine hydrolase [Cyanobacteriota bacterium]|nr:serine hydrolase [Cyanobacteriota bacterium]
MSRSKPRRDRRRNLRLLTDPAQAPAATFTVVAQSVEEEKPLPKTKPRRQSWARRVSLGVLRAGIIGGGLAVVAGTLLTVFTPTRFLDSEPAAAAPQKKGVKPQELWGLTQKLFPSAKPAASQASTAAKGTAPAPQEITALKQKIAALRPKAPSKITPYAYFWEVDSQEYVNLTGNQALPAASTIKIPLAVAFFQAVDRGQIQLQEQLPLTQAVVAGGAGEMQYQIGKVKSFSALETVTKMIVISDNTATNMILTRLGGKAEVNRRFQSWGLNHTTVNNLLPDLEGTNKTSPQDLVNLLRKIHQGELLSLKSRDRLLGIMRETKTRTLLPQGLEPGAVISHKTGDIGTILGDAGIIDMPNGRRYIGAVFATRPYNDPAARTLIQNISRTTYQHFKGTTPAPKPVLAEKPKAKPSP